MNGKGVLILLLFMLILGGGCADFRTVGRQELTGEQVAEVLGLIMPAANWSFMICSNSFRQWYGTGLTLCRIGLESIISMRWLVISVCLHSANPFDSISMQTFFNSDRISSAFFSQSS